MRLEDSDKSYESEVLGLYCRPGPMTYMALCGSILRGLRVKELSFENTRGTADKHCFRIVGQRHQTYPIEGGSTWVYGYLYHTPPLNQDVHHKGPNTISLAPAGYRPASTSHLMAVVRILLLSVIYCVLQSKCAIYLYPNHVKIWRPVDRRPRT